MTRGMNFRNPILREYTALSSLCLCLYPPEVSHCRSRNGILARKAQERALTMRKVQIQSCGKTRSVSTSQTAREISNNKKLTILHLRNVSRKKF